MPSKQSIADGTLVTPVGAAVQVIRQTVGYADFTDGTGTSGTLALPATIPAGSWVIGCKVDVVTGFTGDATAVMDVGDGSDADKFSYTTFNVYTAATQLMEQADAGAAGTETGLAMVTSDATPTLTVTGGADFTSITAGELEIAIYYIETAPLS
jgi:hypothetical protein